MGDTTISFVCVIVVAILFGIEIGVIDWLVRLVLKKAIKEDKLPWN
jgi:preprotein translocase subunit SecE